MLDKLKYILWVSLPSLFMNTHMVFAKRNFAGMSYGEGGELKFTVPKTPGEAYGVDSTTTIVAEQNRLIEILKIVIQGAEGIVAIGMVGMFVVKAFMLVTAPDDTPLIKYKRAWEMVLCLFGIALASGAWYVTGVVFNAFWQV